MQSYIHVQYSNASTPQYTMANDNSTNGGGSTEYDLKKYLLLLATLVATVTYVAGLNLPGGSWLEDTPEGQLAGDSILRHTNYWRYIVFYYFNAISFAASLLVGLLLLLLHKDGDDWGGWLLCIVRIIMLVDMLGLIGAYGAGSSHDDFTTISGACLLASVILTYAIAWLKYKSKEKNNLSSPSPSPSSPSPSSPSPSPSSLKQTIIRKREIQLVLAVFAATDAYVAGLNPPGGFWRSSEEGHHTAGEPVLQGLHRTRYRAFFFFNTIAFVASLLAVVLIVGYHKLQRQLEERFSLTVRNLALYGPIVTALFGLGGAYISGSCRDSKHTAYVIVLLVVVAASIASLLLVAQNYMPTCFDKIEQRLKSCRSCLPEGENRYDWLKNREDIQLLPILAATISYTAGVDPPGGVWARSGVGHNVGDPILLTTHPVRYRLFFYFNSTALVASLVITAILLCQSLRLLVRKHTMEAFMILDLFALIGAFAAGGSRDTTTSVYTVALAGAVLVYVVIHILFCTLEPQTAGAGAVAEEDEDGLKKKREVLLLLAILGATLAYQAGLTPPGGLWEEDDARSGHRAGFPVLQAKYPVRYRVFYYCNAASFMASVALIVLLRNRDLYRPGIKCYALYVCMVTGMLVLMGAYSAGSSMHLKTSIIVLVLASVLTAAAILVAVYVRCLRGQRPRRAHAAVSPSPPADAPTEGEEADMKTVLYLMLVGTLGASVTYLTGLKPPGGLWREDGDGHAAGNPVLHDTGKTRYNVFFYSNSLSFVVSISIIAALLLRMILQGGNGKQQAARPSVVLHLWPMHTAMLLDMLALLVAYAAGSARKWSTSTKVVLLPVPVLVAFCAVLFLYYYGKQQQQQQQQETTNNSTGSGA